VNCAKVQSLMGAWIDGELDAGDHTALESHLETCEECRAATDLLRATDAELSRAFAPHRDVAKQVADRTNAALADQSVRIDEGRSRIRGYWFSLVGAAAAGFLLAVMFYQTWFVSTDQTEQRAKNTDAESEATVARLVVAIGEVELRQADSAQWHRIADPASFVCPTGGAVRTGPGVRCELETPDGCIIRLNNDTEIALNSGREVQLRRGQLWCSSPEDVSLTVLADHDATTSDDHVKPPVKNESPWTFTCPSNTSLLTSFQQDGVVQVTSASGEIEVRTQSGSQRLKQGETAVIAEEGSVTTVPANDPVLGSSWIHPLLMKKGFANREISGRVDELLARIGYTKVSYLYEQEIRSLGEYGVLPLLRYVESPASLDDRPRRNHAMQILADVAPSWAVAELIGLLSDEDPEIRFLAATALKRLTAQNQGRTPEQWRESLENCAVAIDRWNSWWKENSQRYPSL